MKKTMAFILGMIFGLCLDLYVCAENVRYFVPFVYVDSIQFETEKDMHNIYYELEKDSLGNQYEHIKLVSNDSIIQTFKYTYQESDTTWRIPIDNKLKELEDELINTKDKELRKQIQYHINFLKTKYYEH